MSAISQRESLGERLARAYSGAVFDVLRGKGVRDTILPKDVRPLDPGLTIGGPVFTMRGRPTPGAGAHETLLAWTDFLGRAPAAHIVVCEGNDSDRALMGELSAETLQKRGVSGYVTDGGCRDCNFIREIRFPVFARYQTPRDVVGAWMPECFDIPVRIGDVEVSPGDYLIADVDGAVLIPAQLVAEVVEEVEQVMTTENQVRKAILSGVSPQEAYLRYGKF